MPDAATKAKLLQIAGWADGLMDDESQDRTMILEGTTQWLYDLANECDKDEAHYTKMYTRY